MLRRKLAFAVLLAVASGCSGDFSKRHYILAEKLWADGKYEASVAEFEKVNRRDPDGDLGLQALFRAAMTQTLFLGQHEPAIEKFRSYIDKARDKALALRAYEQIGEIYYSKLSKYSEAIQIYRALITAFPEDPQSADALFKIGKSYFKLMKFQDAISTFADLQGAFPKSPWAERAAYEVGVSYFASGEQELTDRAPGTVVYQKAISAFERFIEKFPYSSLVVEAKFGIANCMEELNQLDSAASLYREIEATYPSPNVIKIRLTRITERLAQKNRGS